jgi:hypothetical protein
MFTFGLILFGTSTLYLGYKVGNKFEFKLWKKKAKPNEVVFWDGDKE